MSEKDKIPHQPTKLFQPDIGRSHNCLLVQFAGPSEIRNRIITKFSDAKSNDELHRTFNIYLLNTHYRSIYCEVQYVLIN